MDVKLQTIDESLSRFKGPVWVEELPQSLFGNIQTRISFLEKRQQKIKVVLILLLSFVSALVFSGLSLFVYKQFVSSGIDKIFSLVFSDSGSILTYWQDYLYYILESLPVVSIIVVLVGLAVFLELVRLSINNIYKYKLIIRHNIYGKV